MHLPSLSRIGIAGATGLVGSELRSILRNRGVAERCIVASSTEQCPLWFLATPPDVSRSLVAELRSDDTTIIDLSSAFRLDVPLVVPELNGGVLDAAPQLVASPNCTATILALAVSPLLPFGIASITVSTYQAISGAGQEALQELGRERPTERPILGEPLSHNVFRHESAIDSATGRTGEEQKLIEESRRLLALPELPITATCMRVPVRRSHLESLTVELDTAPPAADVAAAFRLSTAVTFLDDRCPTALSVEGRDDVILGHLRHNSPTSISMVAAGDQLRVGAALNAVRIAEQLPH
ncbi:MAG: Asd/ArgC dimerization domain-containing protein [Phycisphaerales bacterium]|nr:Asd/ArgC dimerization domain-containing protein [Phycisphaerales bacterium]